MFLWRIKILVRIYHLLTAKFMNSVKKKQKEYQKKFVIKYKYSLYIQFILIP